MLMHTSRGYVCNTGIFVLWTRQNERNTKCKEQRKTEKEKKKVKRKKVKPVDNSSVEIVDGSIVS